MAHAHLKINHGTRRNRDFLPRSAMQCAFGLLVCLSSTIVRGQQVYPQPAGEDAAGFESIFDGKTLDGWEGDPKYWRVENGCLVGEVTPETLLKQNTFIIWRRGTARDFELKVDYRITSRGNSGINYYYSANLCSIRIGVVL